jgi:hypothetical protein
MRDQVELVWLDGGESVKFYTQREFTCQVCGGTCKVGERVHINLSTKLQRHEGCKVKTMRAAA